jgi:hypothetical protein
MKICGLLVDIQEVQGPFCKVARIKEFPDLIYNRKFCGLSPRWTAGGADTGCDGALLARGCLGSPELAGGAQH